MVELLCFFLAVLAAPFKSRRRLEAENAVLRHQLIVLRRKVPGRVPLSNGRPLVPGPAVPIVSVDFAGPYDHPTGDIGLLASGWLSQLLALEVGYSEQTLPNRF